MGLIRLLSRLGRNSRRSEAHDSLKRQRTCRFEEIESRRLMASDVHVGAVYYEPASGLDTEPNTIQVTFQGGAADTQLTRLVIDGNKDGGSLFFNDAIFDTADGGLGAYGFGPLTILAHQGFQITGSQVEDGGTRLVLDFAGFTAGETLLLSIDVDQVLFIDGGPHPTDVDVDAVDEGAEFQRSHFTTTFTAPHYFDLTTTTLFWDKFDTNFTKADAESGTTLDLPRDRYTSTENQSVLTAGAVAVAPQVPRPNSLAGVVFSDSDLDNHQDTGEQGIGGVSLTLLRKEGANYVSTGLTTVTNSQGAYRFDQLSIGTYRVVETQPQGYFSVGATAGTVAGQTRGVVVTPDIISEASLLGGDDSIRNDFAEALPNSISGFVGVDCEENPNPPPIAGVTIQLLDQTQQIIRTTTTDTSGNYRFDNLPAGVYSVVEVQPNGYFQGDVHVGSAGGRIKNIDAIEQIVLTAGINGVHYDFCELLPVSIAGHVGVDNDGNCEGDASTPPIAGVVVHLLDANGKSIATTTTNSQGNYLFDNLAPGTYGVFEEQPTGYFNGDNMAGSAGGVVSALDTVTLIVLASGVHAVNYNFCEMQPAQIGGAVHVSPSGDCETDPNVAPLQGVIVQLLNQNGSVIATTTTDAMGHYQFTNLAPGTYGVRELQPAGYFNGDTEVGSEGGVEGNDLITSVVLMGGVVATDYDFCEMLPANLSGFVHVDTTGDCENNPDAPPLPGVVIRLLDAQGTTIRTTTTDLNGYYQFTNLEPGVYSVREQQPAGYFDGDQHVGSAGGLEFDDLIADIMLMGGVDAVHYDFCEIPPANLCGYVYIDLNNNGNLDPGEGGIAGVTLHLLDASGNPTGQTAITDASGLYCFMGLRPGTYGVSETQPTSYLDGLDTPGNAGGVAHNPGDLITGAVLTAGLDAHDYNFGELPPAMISGMVVAQNGGSCEIEDGATPLAGVTVYLLDGHGTILAATTTDMHGEYQFTGLRPGDYSVREEQPAGYFEGDAEPGTLGGAADGGSLIIGVNIAPGAQGLHYDFCEVPPAIISGFFFQDGPPIVLDFAGQVPNVPALRDGKLTADDTRLAGVRLELRDGVTGAPILGAAALTGFYAANQAITVLTDAAGHYEFRGLAPGVYAVYDVRPSGYLPGIDTAGSLGGLVISPYTTVDADVLAQLVQPPLEDAILRIELPSGKNSTDNNFSVVTTTEGVPLFAFPPAVQPPPPLMMPGVFPALELAPLPILPFEFLVAPVLTRAGGSLYTWHLSIIDAGHPRELEAADPAVQLTAMRPGADSLWDDVSLDEGEFHLGTRDARGAISARKVRFGLRGAFPVGGDFNGDGTFEIGVFAKGKWYIDLNDDGVWDEGDLFAKLGHDGDRPVTGDWDGDGKTDIGIFGPAWSGDPRAIAHEPGIPDPQNPNVGVHKNIPRPAEKNARGERTMQLAARGKPRADLIDHVFLYGLPGDFPVVGDWNGDGTAGIAVFRDGNWWRDTDGNGKRSEADQRSQYGQPGDIPIVGDFNGDGIDELGVFRNGAWYIDTNGNGVIDDDDQVFQLGGQGDLPVVGDWDGDGRSDPGVYHDLRKAG